MNHSRNNKKNSGYTLIETLVASAVMMVAIGAASSLSLSMVAQEEMSERSVRVINHLENAANLYNLGFDTDEIAEILPNDPAVFDMTYTPLSRNVSGFGSIEVMRIRVRYIPSGATSGNKAGELSWTGGLPNKKRAHTVQLIRTTP